MLIADYGLYYAENTFVAGFSGQRKKSHAQWMHHQNLSESMRWEITESFSTFVKDSAILIYLDNNENKRESPNVKMTRLFFELLLPRKADYTLFRDQLTATDGMTFRVW